MLNDYPQLISRLTNTPWVITQEYLAVILDIVNLRLSGKAYSDEEIRIRLEAVGEEDTRKNPRIQVGGGVGLMGIYGPIFPKANLFTMISGGASAENITSDIRELAANEKVEAIVLDIDSPGGSAEMIMETGMEIRKAREVKPVYAVANTTAASGAYWLGAQATKLYVTPSGKVGSIGVYTAHEDLSRQNEAAGRKVTYISAGRYKTAGNSDEPLTQDAKDYMQEVVDSIYDQFVQEVATGRGVTTDTVLADFGQGRMLLADNAKSAGMVDDVRTLDNTLSELLAEFKSPASVGGALGGAMARVHAQATAQISAARLEVVDLEHSEPGTGTPPVPKETEKEKDQEQGWRRDTPSDIDTNTLEGGVMNEQELRAKLGIGPEDSIEEAVDSLVAKAAPLDAAISTLEAKQTFRTMFPAEAEKMDRLEAKDRITEAKEFAEQFESIEGMNGAGFSALCLEKTTTAALALAEGTFTREMLAELLTAVASNGVVDYSEKGSSRSGADKETVSDDPRKAFAAKVSEIMEEDSLDYEAAVALTAEKYPDMLAAYQSAVPNKP